MKRSYSSSFKQLESPSKIQAPDLDVSLNSNRPRSNGFPLNSSVNSAANNTFTMNGTTDSREGAQEASSRRRDSSVTEKTFFFTGTAERVLAWNRILKSRCLFEVISSFVSIQESPDNFQNIILLKDKKGPILRVVHYFDHEMPEECLTVGQMLRCVGYMTGANTLTAVSLRKAAPDEFASLKRHCYFGDFTITGLINSEEH